MPALLAAPGLGLLAAAWSAGFSWTWTSTIGPGLTEAGPDAAIAAMRAA